MRFNDGKAKFFLGKPIKTGETYFVDLYNEEFSRDAEPMKGGFQDNYYYQMVDNIRNYKGTRRIPVYNNYYSIKIDGNFKDWEEVKPVFHDDKDDTFHRHHPGYGRIKEYINNTGRNDIIKVKVAVEDDYAFYVESSQTITGYGQPELDEFILHHKRQRTAGLGGLSVPGKPISEK